MTNETVTVYAGREFEANQDVQYDPLDIPNGSEDGNGYAPDPLTAREKEGFRQFAEWRARQHWYGCQECNEAREVAIRWANGNYIGCDGNYHRITHLVPMDFILAIKATRADIVAEYKILSAV